MAKLFDKLMNRVIKGKLTIDSGDDVSALLPENLKYGHYIYDGDETFKWVEEIPSDYNGIAFDFLDDGLYVLGYSNGSSVYDTYISTSGISVNHDGESASFDFDGADKINFASLTHSLAELDSTLRQLVEDAVADNFGDGVSCTQAQWNVIKALLDKSLYFNYGGVSLIKSFTDGINDYCFGMTNSDTGYILELLFESENSILKAKYGEV